MGSVVELAAWIIIGEALMRLFLNSNRQKQNDIEAEAVKAEYQACQNNEYDENLSQISRRNWSRRKEDLRIRYPQHLVKPPDGKYFAEAREELNFERKRDFRERRLGYIGAGIAVVIAVIYRYIFDGPMPSVLGPVVGSSVVIVGGILIFGFVQARNEWRDLVRKRLNTK